MKYLYTAVHPTQPELAVNLVLASKPTNGAKPIITAHARYPRIIHGEVLTHRKFGRNARSSRAVPVKTMLNEVRTQPFVPWHWGKNRSGMQADEEYDAPVQLFQAEGNVGYYWASREDAWLDACAKAACAAEGFMNAGYHKQLANRLLEPFSWIDTLITSTSWANFLHLRDHKDAEPHFQDLAKLFKEAIEWLYDTDSFQILEPGHWHLPYVTEQDWDRSWDWCSVNENYGAPTCQRQVEILKKISAARCARISYTPFDGNASFDRELERFQLLINSDRLHASPCEHQATPDTVSHYDHIRVEDDDEELVDAGEMFDHPKLHGNLDAGWIQFRKTLKGEYMEDAA